MSGWRVSGWIDEWMEDGWVYQINGQLIFSNLFLHLTSYSFLQLPDISFSRIFFLRCRASIDDTEYHRHHPRSIKGP